MMPSIYKYLLSIAILGSIVGGTIAQTVAIPQQQAQKVLAQMLAATVKIESLNSNGNWTGEAGSGSIISPQGHILTNYHVVEDDTTQSIHREARILLSQNPETAPQERYIATYLMGDKQLDLAILQIAKDSNYTALPTSKQFDFIPLGDSDQLILGQDIFLWGYPLRGGSTISNSQGTVGGFLGEDYMSGGRRWIKTEAQMGAGISGGAAIDAGGVLIGIPTAAVVSSTQGGQTIPLDVRQNVLRPSKLAWELIQQARLDSLIRLQPLNGGVETPRATQQPSYTFDNLRGTWQGQGYFLNGTPFVFTMTVYGHAALNSVIGDVDWPDYQCGGEILYKASQGEVYVLGAGRIRGPCQPLTMYLTYQPSQDSPIVVDFYYPYDGSFAYRAYLKRQ
ncbi:MAG: serine protease [Deinococcales bacterium]